MRLDRVMPALLGLLLMTANGCHSATAPDPLVGTWLATTFRVVPPGRAQQDVLAAGGTLGVNVANSAAFITAGTVILPPAVTGGATYNASLAGTAVKTGNTVQIATTADTFVRDLIFTLNENRLEALNEVVGGTTYDIVLTRQ